MRALADALDPPLKRVPLPERELGVIGELGALGFVCFAIFQPRLQADAAVKQAIAAQKAGTAAAVAEAERITAEHAAAPYAGTSPLDELRRDPTAVEPDELAGGVTVGETEPDLLLQVDALAREHGITPERIVNVQRELGHEGELLDAYPSVPTLDDGTPLDRGVE